MKLSHYDRTMIHGLELMTRPDILRPPEDHKMIVRILEISAERSSAISQLEPLVREVRRVADNRGHHSGILYQLERTMFEFDRMCMAAHWDAAKETGR